MLRSLLRCCALVTSLTVLLGACASEEERFDQHLAQAEAYQEQGLTREAAIELRSALKLQPKSAVVNMKLGDLLRQSGGAENALFFYQEAERLDPQWLEPLLAQLRFVPSSDLERIDEIVKRGLELAPEDPRVHQRRSVLALRKLDTEEALAAALTAVELGPDDPASHLSLGIVYQAMLREQRLAKQTPDEELFRSALRAFDKADAGETSIQARIERARTLASWPGHREEANAAFDAALERASESGATPRELLLAEEIAARAHRLHDVKRERQALEAIIAIDPAQLNEVQRFTLGQPEIRIRQAWGKLAELAEAEEEGSGAAVLQRLIEASPDDPSAHRLYAQFLQSHGRSDEALAHLEATADRGVAPAMLLDDAVRTALQGGDGQRARAYVKRLVAQHPGDPYTLLARARVHLGLRRYAEAEDLLGRVNQVAETAESQRLLAQAAFAGRRLDAAQTAIDRSLELNPRSPAALRLGAQILYQRGDWPAVLLMLTRLRATGDRLEAQDRLLMVRPFYEMGREETGRKLLLELLAKWDPPPDPVIFAFVANEGERDPETALRLLDEALERNPASPSLLPRAVEFDVRAGEIERALARLDRALEARPDAPVLLAIRARVYFQAGRLEESERDARQAFERNPSIAGMPELIMSIYQRRGKLDVAIEQLEASESAGLLKPQHRMLLGRLHLQQGNSARAEALLEAALAEDAGLAGAKNDLAFLLAREGRDLGRALELALEAQQALGENISVLDTLGYVMLRRGLAGPAADQFGHALRLADEQGQPPRAYLFYHMGLALRALGQEQAAAEHLERALAVDPGFPDAADARQQLDAARAAASAELTPSS